MDEAVESPPVDDLTVTELADDTNASEVSIELALTELIEGYSEFFGDDGDDTAEGQSGHDYLN